jgi:molecular chaperone DnaJ
MQIEFRDSVFGLEKDINVESGKVRIKTPKGVRDGTELRFAGKGMPGPKDMPSGDLLITIRVKAPKEFNIIREDIVMEKKIDIVQASLGDVIEVDVVDEKTRSGIGKAKLKIPAGTQPGTRFVLRGKGMPRLNRGGRGDAYIQVNISVPTSLSRKQKELLETFYK